MREYAYETAKKLRVAIEAARAQGVLPRLSEDLVLAGTDLAFDQDPAIVKLAAELTEIGKKAAELDKLLGIAEARMAGLL